MPTRIAARETAEAQRQKRKAPTSKPKPPPGGYGLNRPPSRNPITLDPDVKTARAPPPTGDRPRTRAQLLAARRRDDTRVLERARELHSAREREMGVRDEANPFEDQQALVQEASGATERRRRGP